MKILALLRVKNEEKYLPKLFDQLGRITNGVIVLDDGSTDATASICKERFEFIDYYYQQLPYHEGRDHIFLHEQAEKYHPDWILALDADEIFCEENLGLIRRITKVVPKEIWGFAFPFLYLWNDESHYRVDGVYKDMVALRLFRYFPNQLPSNERLHVPAVPKEVSGSNRWATVGDVRLKHFGYMLERDRIAKYNDLVRRDREILGSKEFSKQVGGVGDYSHIIAKKVKLKKI